MNALQSAPPHSVPAQVRKTPELRAYQIDVLERVRQRYREGHRSVILQAACGSGKSLCASEIMRLASEKRKRTVFFAHRRRLVTQMGGHLKSFGVDHGLIMAGEDARPWALAQVACRDTLLSRAVRSDRMELPPADFVIVDEGHRLGRDNEYARLAGAYPKAKLLILTATPVWPDGTGMGAVATAMECAVPASQLVRDGHLVPVRCFAPERMGKGGKREKGLRGDPVAHWLMYAEGSPTVLFAGTVAASKAVADRFVAAGIAAEHIDASTPDKDRDAIMERVESGRTKVMCNAAIATEGFDLPIVRCVQLLRTAGSYVLFVQACGRAQRPYPGKSSALLIDHSGAIFDHGFPDEDVEWSLDTGESVEERIRRDKKEGKRREPVVCAGCGCVFSGRPTCPECGKALPKARKKRGDDPRQELLLEVDRDAPAPSPAERLSEALGCWVSSCFKAANGRRTAWAAAMVFKGRHKCLPDQFPGLAEAARQKGYALPRGQQWRQPAADLFPQCQRGG